MSENLKRILRDEIACYEASLSTTPHLSRIHHAEVALLALLEEKNHPVVPLRDTVERDGLGRPVAKPPARGEGDDPGLWSTG